METFSELTMIPVQHFMEIFTGNSIMPPKEVFIMLDEESSLQHEHGTSIVLINRLWFCQVRLKRLQQMPELIAHARNGGRFNLDPLIELHQNEDEEIVINNGHHRVTAAWLGGRKILYREEFIILYKDAYRPRFGTIDVFLARLPAGVLEWLRQGESTPQAPNEGLVLIVYRASSTYRSCIYLSACLLFPLA